MDRDFEMCFLATLRLTLLDDQPAIMNVLRSDLDDIAAAQAGVEDQAKGQPSLRADWVFRLNSLNVLLRPSFVSCFFTFGRVTPSVGSSGMRPSAIAHLNNARNELRKLRTQMAWLLL